MASSLRALLCGKATKTLSPAAPGPASALRTSLEHIGSTLDAFLRELAWLRGASDTRVTLFGPYVGRSILELGTTALVGRLDAFRLLGLRAHQMQSEYELGKRHRIAFQWQGDVCQAEKTQELWPDTDFSKIPRALVGPHYGNAIWAPAFERMIDETAELEGGEWLAELRQWTADAFLPRLRSEIERAYSSLSKGIHHEFVVPPGVTYDRITVARDINASVKAAATLGLVCNFVDHAPDRTGPSRAATLFEQIQRKELF